MNSFVSEAVGRRNQWHLLLPDIPAQYNESLTQPGFVPNKVYDDPETADRALARIKRNIKMNAGGVPQIAVGDLVRVRVKPIESRGFYRVTEVAWSERVYTVARIENTDGRPYFFLEGWTGDKLVRRDQRRSFPMQCKEQRGRQAAHNRRMPAPGPIAPA